MNGVILMRLKARPYKGRYASRISTNRMNDMLLSAPTPDRSEMYKEAKEFEKILKVRRKKSGL